VHLLLRLVFFVLFTALICLFGEESALGRTPQQLLLLLWELQGSVGNVSGDPVGGTVGCRHFE